jgi:RNA polymerase sigma factor (sigma-70 family)
MSSKWDAEFTQWLNEREVKFFRAAQRIAYDKQNAEDVFQEAMLDIYRRWSKVRNHPNLDGYAINVIFSKHVDLRRKWARRQAEKERTWEYAEAVQPPIDLSDGWVEATAVQMALRELNASQRSVLVLTYMYSMPLDEIGKILNIPTGTVASQLARGRDAVARYLSETGELTYKQSRREITMDTVFDAEIVEEGEDE